MIKATSSLSFYRPQRISKQFSGISLYNTRREPSKLSCSVLGHYDDSDVNSICAKEDDDANDDPAGCSTTENVQVYVRMRPLIDKVF